MRQEYFRLRSAVVKFSPSVLRQPSKDLIDDAEHGSVLNKTKRGKGRPIIECVSRRWTKRFMSVSRIVLRSQTGKQMVFNEEKSFIFKYIVHHLEN